MKHDDSGEPLSICPNKVDVDQAMNPGVKGRSSK